MTSAPPLLSIEGVCMRFAGLQALRNVTFDVRSGEILAVIGPNGAGKTTLLNIVSGALSPAAGVIRFHGREIQGQPAHAVALLGITRTFQSLDLFRHLTVLENAMAGGVAVSHVGIVASLGALPVVRRQRAVLEARAHELLALVGLERRAGDLAAGLPAGQQRLLAIARMLATGGELVILDEPGAGLNQVEKAHLADVIRQLPARGKTVVFVEHDMALVGQLAERIVVLNHGELIASGTPDEIRQAPRVIEAYLGVERAAMSSASQDDAAVSQAEPPPRADGMRGLLALRDVEVAYGGARALQGVSLDVHRGEIVALVGANGAGKSTLLKTVARMVAHQRGDVTFDGVDLRGLTPQAVVRAGVSLVPEGRELFPSLSVWDNLALGQFARGGGTRAHLERRAEEIFSLFPVLHERRRQLAGTLSGGEGQMLAIGRALMSGPTLLMLDEPSLGLAPQLVAEILARLAVLRRTGLTIVLVEQNARAALEIADRGYVLETGRIVVQGTGRRLLADPDVSTAYLGRAALPLGEQAPNRPDVLTTHQRRRGV